MNYEQDFFLTVERTRSLIKGVWGGGGENFVRIKQTVIMKRRSVLTRTGPKIVAFFFSFFIS